MAVKREQQGVSAARSSRHSGKNADSQGLVLHPAKSSYLYQLLHGLKHPRFATTSTVSGFDLSSIGYTDHVNAVKIEGVDSFGASPGFDLAFVKGLEGSSVQVPDSMPTVLALGSVLLGFAGARAFRRRVR